MWVKWPLQPPKITTTFRSINGFALPSMHRNNAPLLIVSYLWNFCHRLVRYYWQTCTKKGFSQNLPCQDPGIFCCQSNQLEFLGSAQFSAAQKVITTYGSEPATGLWHKANFLNHASSRLGVIPPRCHPPKSLSDSTPLARNHGECRRWNQTLGPWESGCLILRGWNIAQ
jgi:hypothetical protein